MVHIDSSQEITLREVWKSNMEEEFDRLADLIEEYPVVAMDTEFPGILSTPAVWLYLSKIKFNKI